MCYHCNKVSCYETIILDHTVKYHLHDTGAFKMRKSRLDEESGKVVYRAQRYNMNLHDVAQKMRDGINIILDTEQEEIHCALIGNKHCKSQTVQSKFKSNNSCHATGPDTTQSQSSPRLCLNTEETASAPVHIQYKDFSKQGSVESDIPSKMSAESKCIDSNTIPIESASKSFPRTKEVVSHTLVIESMNFSETGITESGNTPKLFPETSNSVEVNSSEADTTESELIKLMPQVLEVLKAQGRDDDFMSAIKGLANGTLSVDNMPLHLLLDVGQYVRESENDNIGAMRYSKTSVDYWTVIRKLLHQKGITFLKGDGPCKGLYTAVHC